MNPEEQSVAVVLTFAPNFVLMAFIPSSLSFPVTLAHCFLVASVTCWTKQHLSVAVFDPTHLSLLSGATLRLLPQSFEVGKEETVGSAGHFRSATFLYVSMIS